MSRVKRTTVNNLVCLNLPHLVLHIFYGVWPFQVTVTPFLARNLQYTSHDKKMHCIIAKSWRGELYSYAQFPRCNFSTSDSSSHPEEYFLYLPGVNTIDHNWATLADRQWGSSLLNHQDVLYIGIQQCWKFKVLSLFLDSFNVFLSLNHNYTHQWSSIHGTLCQPLPGPLHIPIEVAGCG